MSDETPVVALGWNLPAPCSTPELISVLHGVLEAVEAKDSFEGTITYVMPTDEPWLEGADFGLLARWRVGNSMGQGGLTSFIKEVPEDQLGQFAGNADLTNGPGMGEAIQLVKFLAGLDADEEARKTITLQEIIDRAKATYRDGS